MLPATLTDVLAAVHPFITAWGIPIAYIVCCGIERRLSAHGDIPIPQDEAPSPRVPALHPTLLAALRCHSEFKTRSETDAVQAALARIVQLIARADLSFIELSPAQAERRERTEDEADELQAGPIVSEQRARRRERRHGRRATSSQPLRAYGGRLVLSVRTTALDDIDRGAVGLVMPPGTVSATVEELCTFTDRVRERYTRLGGYLGRYTDDLCRAGLVEHPGLIPRILFSMPVMMLVTILGIALPVTADIDGALAYGTVALLIAAFVARALLVDMGTRLMSEGARVLGRAAANVRWAEIALRGCEGRIDSLSDDEAVDLMAALIALDRRDLASDLAEQLIADGRTNLSEATPLAQAVSFCARRPYSDASSMRTCASPIDLIVEAVEKFVHSMRD